MSAGRWNQSALKPHLVSNSKNIKDYYPRHQKGHEHLLQRVHTKFRRAISQGNTVTLLRQCQGKICEELFPLHTIKNEPELMKCNNNLQTSKPSVQHRF